MIEDFDLVPTTLFLKTRTSVLQLGGASQLSESFKAAGVKSERGGGSLSCTKKWSVSYLNLSSVVFHRSYFATVLRIKKEYIVHHQEYFTR